MKRFATLIALLFIAQSVRSDTTFYDAVTWDFGSSFTINSGITAKFMPGSVVDATGATLVGFPGGTGASSFLGLTDTPDFYTGQGGKVVAVKTDASGLEFIVPAGGGGGGTVTNFSSGNLTPLFNTSVLNPTTIPALSFTLLSASPHTFLGNETGSTTAPHYVQPNFTDLAGDFALTQTPTIGASTLIGRTSTGPGDWMSITLGTGLLMVGSDLRLATTVGDVLSSSTPTVGQVGVWVDATHLKGVTSLAGGSVGQVLKKSTSADYEWEWAADLSGGGTGSSSFITLTDVPPSYTGAAGKLVAVNGTANGLEFITAPSGGGAVNSVFGRTGVVVAQVGDYATFYQPLDTDLTNIAALAGQTAFGRGFLTQIDAAGSRTYIGAGTSNFDGTFNALTGKPTTLVGYGITDAQPLDSDLTALAATTGTNTVYYRSGTGIWSAVSFGPNLSWASGTLNAANANWDTAYTDRMKWDGGSTGLVAATGRTSLGLDIGVNVQAYDADLTSLAAASSTNAIYYRSALGSWAPVTIGGNMTFTGGTLNSNSGGDVGGPASSTDLGFALFSGTSGKTIRTIASSGIVLSTSGVFGVIPDNHVSWDTASSQSRQWDGGATGLVAATGRASLALGAVTNDAQTQAAVVPNTIPTDGQLLVGSSTNSKYFPRTVSGSGATVTMGATGVLTIDAVTDAALVNVPTHAAIVPNTAPAAGQILVGSGTAYVPKTVSGSQATVTMSSAGVITIDALTNAGLQNSTMTFANAAVALGGTVTADNAIGLATGTGLMKRSGINSYTIATAGTDYKVGTQNTINIRFITVAGTFTPTAGVTSLWVEGVGGGGGGGGESVTGTNAAGQGGSGGGGGYAGVYIPTPAASYNVTVGAGGAGGSAAGGNGGAGGNTTFGVVLTATGGGGGTGMTGGGVFAEASSNGFAGAGGTGTVGGVFIPGQDGGPFLCMGASGTTVWGVTGDGGNSVWGMGARGRAGHSAAGGAFAGDVGGKFGGGGSGAEGGTTAGAKAGGAGAVGLIKVTEIF